MGLLLRLSDLREREVINIHDGTRLGEVEDIEIDLETGRVLTLVVPETGGLLKIFGRGNEMVIPWEMIKKLGEDVILVEIGEGVDLKSEE